MRSQQPLFWDLGRLLFKFKVVFLGLLLLSGLVVWGFNSKQILFNYYQQVKRYLYQSQQTDFIRESFDTIVENYWQKVDPEKLVILYSKAADKVAGKPVTVSGNSEEDLLESLYLYIKTLPVDKRNDFTTKTVATVLANLTPLGRSSLYTQKQETSLKNTISNINPNQDLYKDLGVEKQADLNKITQTYNEQSRKLSQESSPDAQQRLSELNQAYQVLKDPNKKNLYDQSGSLPVTTDRFLTPNVYYLKLDKFSPFSFNEFQSDLQKLTSPPPYIVIDLRGNIGGSVDTTPYFLGSFLGPNLTGYELLHQAQRLPVSTIGDKNPNLAVKKLIILVDNQTQSSAEVVTSGLKKYHLGIIVGQKTHGWGTIERVFPLSHQLDLTHKYSLFLVHSLTLDDQDKPIEGHGVEPDILTSDPSWSEKLFEVVGSDELIKALRQVIL